MANYRVGKQVFIISKEKSHIDLTFAEQKCAICKEPLGYGKEYKLIGDEENQRFKRAHIKCLGK